MSNDPHSARETLFKLSPGDMLIHASDDGSYWIVATPRQGVVSTHDRFEEALARARGLQSDNPERIVNIRLCVDDHPSLTPRVERVRL